MAIFVFVCCAYLSFARMDNTYFWDDEAHVGIVAKNFLSTGRLTGWDGRNLLAYRNGTLLDKGLRTINPPLDYLVAAVSFRVFGPSTWAGRLPFVIAGLIGLAIFAILLRHDFGNNDWLWVYSLAVLAFSPVFLLNIRQCRYYALALLFSQLIFYAYRRCLATERTRWFLILSTAAILLFYSHFLLCGAFLLALGVYHLVFHRHDLGKKGWGKLAAAVGVFALATLPYALYYSIWRRPQYVAREDFYFRQLKLLWWNLRELNLLGCLPWTVAVGLAYFLIRNRQKEGASSTTLQWAAFSLGYVFFMALSSPQPANVEAIADLRYLIPIVPFLAGMVGAFLWFVHKKSRIVALACLALIITSNVLTLSPFNWKFRWLLPAYIGEIHRDYPTSYSAAVEFLLKSAARDDLVYASPEYCNYPLMFYSGDKFRFCCLLNARTPLPVETVKNLAAPLFMEEHFPNWFIAFGGKPAVLKLLEYFSRTHTSHGKTVQFDYRLVKTLDVFWFDTSRPELPRHRFGPVVDFDRRFEAVYIFRRSEHKNGKRSPMANP